VFGLAVKLPSTTRRQRRARSASPGRLFEALVQLQRRLRGPNGCPWDRRQTHRTLRPYVVEEAYEVVEAIDEGRPGELAEELGDLMLQVIFHAQIATEQGRFDIADVLARLRAKLIRRHPHVFGTRRLRTPAEVVASWEMLKQQEAGFKESSSARSVLDGVPRRLPALLEALRLSRQAARVGLDWDRAEAVVDKLAEEIAELRRLQPARPARPQSHRHCQIEEEVGDLLFTVVSLARHLGIHPEVALKRANAKFRRRVAFIEKQAAARGHSLAALSTEELERLWEQAKSATRQPR
jgi:tetrapyrrole methylase family protein/MazG family protein